MVAIEATRRRTAGGLVVVCAAQFVIGVDGLAVAVALTAPRVLPEGRAEGAAGAWQLHGHPADRGG